MESEPNTAEDVTPKRKRGGQPGNKGGRPPTHGLRMPIGKLPPGCSYLGRVLGEFRVAIEGAVMAKRGEIDAYSAALISTAVLHEQRSRLIGRYLSLQGADASKSVTSKKAVTEANGVTSTAVVTKQTGLSVMESINLLEAQGRAADARDRVLQKLGLDRSDRDTFAASFYVDDPPATEGDGR